MTKPKLLPCPFCGPEGNVSLVKGAPNDWWIECFRCDCNGPKTSTKDAAFRGWNTRPADEPHATHEHRWFSIRQFQTPPTEDPQLCECGARRTVTVHLPTDESQLARKLATSLLRRKHMQALLVQVVGLVEEYGAPAWREDWLGQLKLHEQLIAADETTMGRIVTGKYCDHGIPISIECTECTAETRGGSHG